MEHDDFLVQFEYLTVVVNNKFKVIKSIDC